MPAISSRYRSGFSASRVRKAANISPVMRIRRPMPLWGSRRAAEALEIGVDRLDSVLAARHILGYLSVA